MLAGAVVLLLLTAVVALSWSSGPGPSRAAGARPPGLLDVRAGGETLARIDLRRYSRDGRVDRPALARVVGRVVPRERVVSRGAARIHYAYDVAGAVRRGRTVPLTGGAISVSAHVLSAAVAAPVVRQAMRNDCEAASLQILLATIGDRVDQGRLQRALPRSGPLDPARRGSVRVWGDPERGFVGRPDGGGPAGGFGVYERPVAALAATRGHGLLDLTRHRPQSLYRRLLAGHAVMAWIGLSDGPYGRWRSPAGRPVTVNLGEHAVVLTGMRRDGRLTLVNPLAGTAEVWTKADFESRWRLLGRRALAT